MGSVLTKRHKLLTRWGALKTERASWIAGWQDISSYLLPKNGRFFVQDRNKGDGRYNLIYDNTATHALRVLGSGMMAGATSPARPWFKLATGDPTLSRDHEVKLWLDDVTRRMQAVFQKSNTYRALHQIYEELAAFGTAACLFYADFDNVIHLQPLTAGEYALSADYKGRVNTLYREFDMTIAQIVAEFGLENCTLNTRQLFERGELDQWVTVIHAIEPRRDRDATKQDSRNMPFLSCYFETGADDGKYLRESGFNKFPVLAPRWSTAGGDIYGHGPAIECLGDVKQLQHEQLRKAQGIDYQTKPPVQAPTQLRNRDVDMLPGGITFVDAASPQGGIRTTFETNLDLSHLLADIQDVRSRIRASFFADLFLMLATATDTRMTATEVAERHEEKLLMLGPVLERLHYELLDPLIDLTFTRMLEAGLIPTPPEVLSGSELSVEFVSMLAQAQRAIGVNAMDRWLINIGQISQLKPEVLDKMNADEIADDYAEMLGVNPRVVVPTSEVEELRRARDAAMAAKEQAALQQQQAATMGSLGAAAMAPPDALENVTSMFSGYNAPQE